MYAKYDFVFRGFLRFFMKPDKKTLIVIVHKN